MTYIPSEKIRLQIENVFTYHPPINDQTIRYMKIRDAAKAFAELLASECPESRELSRALTHLEDTVSSANAAISRHETTV